MQRLPTRTVGSWLRRTLAALLVLSTVGLPRVAQGQQGGTITGQVTEKGAGTAIPDATVLVVGTQRVTRSGPTGQYRLTNVAPGTYVLRVNRIGFAALSQQVTVTAGSEVSANFALLAAATRLEEVLVSATGVSERKRENGSDVGSITPGTGREPRRDA